MGVLNVQLCGTEKLEWLFEKDEVDDKNNSMNYHYQTVLKKFKNTTLHNTGLEEHTSMVRYLLEETDYCTDELHPNIINEINNNAECPFYYAAYNASEVQMKLVFKHIIHKPDEKTKNNTIVPDGYGESTVLIYSNGFLRCLKYIVEICKENNIDLNLYSSSGTGTNIL